MTQHTIHTKAGDLSLAPVPRQVVIVDTLLHRSFSATYLILVIVGLVGAFGISPSVTEVTNASTASALFGFLAVVGGISFVLSTREQWQRREMFSLFTLLGVLVFYSFAVAITAFVGSDLVRLTTAAMSLSPVPVLLWRGVFILRKFRKPREASARG